MRNQATCWRNKPRSIQNGRSHPPEHDHDGQVQQHALVDETGEDPPAERCGRRRSRRVGFQRRGQRVVIGEPLLRLLRQTAQDHMAQAPGHSRH